jgi:hypothetical protein
MEQAMTNIPGNPDALLTRKPLAASLTEKGYPVRPATLATKATRGGGPPYRLFGRKPLYRWGDALAWAQSCCTEPRCNTSEHHSAAAVSDRQRKTWEPIKGEELETVRVDGRTLITHRSAEKLLLPSPENMSKGETPHPRHRRPRKSHSEVES